MTTSNGELVNKGELYGEFQGVEEWNLGRLKWQDALHKKAAHKALDIGNPDDVGDIYAPKVGIDATGLAQVLAAVKSEPAKRSGIGKWLALAGLATTGIGLWQAPAIIEAFKDDPAPVVQQPDFTDTDTDTQFELHLGRPGE